MRGFTTRGVLIAAVVTRNEVVIPGGEDVLLPGSRAVLFSLTAVAEQVAEFFEEQL